MVEARTDGAGVWSPGRAPTTVGILLLISLTAFEAMGVGTAMPAVVADLGGVSRYAWPFVLFLAAAVFGTVAGGRWCDVRGPRVPLVAAPVLFGAGLIVAGFATTMAGLVTEHLSWHWVFLGLLPVVGLALVLIAPVVRVLRPPTGPAAGDRGAGLVPAALGAAVGVAGLSWALENLDVGGAVAGVVAVAVLVPSLRRLLPRGTVVARPGIAAVVAARGLVAGAFFPVVSFLPLVLTATHGWSLTAAGTPLIVASLGWSGAAAWQARRPDADRALMLRTGFAMIAAGQVALVPVAAGLLPGWLAVGFWGVSGLGMGVAFSAIAYLTLAHSDAGDVGAHSSAAQLLDQLATAVFVGLGGALLVALGSPAVALPVLVAVVACLSGIGAVTAGRTRLHP